MDRMKLFPVGLVVLVMVAILLVVSGCGGTDKATEVSQKQEASPQQGGTVDQSKAQADLPKTLTMGTMPVGSKNNAVGSGIATVLSRNTPMEIKVMATSGPTEFVPMMNAGEVDLGIAATYEAQTGYLGKDLFEQISKGQGYPVRLITVGSVNIFSMLVAGDSGIVTASDLKGKRYAGTVTGSANASALSRAFLANHQLSKDDVKWMAVPGVTDGIRAIIEGRVDSSGSLLGTSTAQELDASHGARYLSIDPSAEAVERLQTEYPAYAIKVEPGDKNVGVVEPMFMMGYDNYLIAREDLPDEVAYAIAKILWEKNEELKPIHAGLQDWTPDRFVSEYASIPYHPGVIKFYKEQGVWTDKIETLQQKLLSAK